MGVWWMSSLRPLKLALHKSISSAPQRLADTWTSKLVQKSQHVVYLHVPTMAADGPQTFRIVCVCHTLVRNSCLANLYCLQRIVAPLMWIFARATDIIPSPFPKTQVCLCLGRVCDAQCPESASSFDCRNPYRLELQAVVSHTARLAMVVATFINMHTVGNVHSL